MSPALRWPRSRPTATSRRRARGLLLGATAGALFGVSDIAIKFLADDIASGVLELTSPWTAAALIASVGAFYASARGLQLAGVGTLTSVAANLTAIVDGILVFRDPVGTGALEITGRMLAFSLVVAGRLDPGSGFAPRGRESSRRSPGRWRRWRTSERGPNGARAHAESRGTFAVHLRRHTLLRERGKLRFPYKALLLVLARATPSARRLRGLFPRRE